MTQYKTRAIISPFSGTMQSFQTATAAPEPGTGSTLLWGEDRFEYADTTALLAAYTNRGPVTLINDGRSGNCARFTYAYLGDQDPLLEKVFAETTDIYIRFWYRISKGGLPYSGATGSGMKWVAPWHAGSVVRWTMGVGTLPGGPVGFLNSGYEFSGHDNQSSGTGHDQPNPFMQNLNKAIRFDTTNDGSWHKYTTRINNDPLGDSSGVGGFHQIWVDDVQLADSRPGQPGVPPEGYTTGFRGINLVQIMGLIVDTIPDITWNFTIDVDDYVIWHN